MNPSSPAALFLGPKTIVPLLLLWHKYARITSMTKSNEVIHEELPVSPFAQEVIHNIRATRFRPDLRDFTGNKLFSNIREGNVSPVEADRIRDEAAAKYKVLSLPKDSVTLELPEAAQPQPEEPEAWSPTDILDKIPTREYDVRERAAGEHLDR